MDFLESIKELEKKISQGLHGWDCTQQDWIIKGSRALQSLTGMLSVGFVLVVWGLSPSEILPLPCFFPHSTLWEKAAELLRALA